VTVHQLPGESILADRIDDHLRHLRLAPDPDRVVVCDLTEAVYQYALRRGSVRVGAECAADLDLPAHLLEDLVRRLIELRLLRPATRDPHGYVPVDPQVAVAALVSPLEGEILHRRDRITSIREQLGGLAPLYADTRQAPAPGGDFRALAAGEVGGALALATADCASELVAVRIGDEADDETQARDLAALERGVRVRVVYQHRVRADLRARAAVKRLVAAGAQVRTSNLLPSPFQVHDTATAIAAWDGDGVQTGNPVLAGLLQQVFECVWDASEPYTTAENGYEGIDDVILRDITRLLAEGMTDETIARRLGMSVRACRRHIARLMRNLDAVSRFQAGTRAASVGLTSA
jgi:hypothetical protein